MLPFGDRIRQLRKEKGWTQNELGKILGLGENLVTHYERGVRFPRPEAIVNISKLFEVSTDYLLGITDERNTTNNSLTKNERLDLIAKSNPILDNKYLEMIKSLNEEQANLLLAKLKEILRTKD
jgi:transcriptional regulator with XRE-family HTH domain